MKQRQGQPGALLWLGAILYLTAIAFAQAADRTLQVTTGDDTEINIEVLDSPGSLLAVWFTDHDEVRPQFEAMLKAVNTSGIEVWRVLPDPRRATDRVVAGRHLPHHRPGRRPSHYRTGDRGIRQR